MKMHIDKYTSWILVSVYMRWLKSQKGFGETHNLLHDVRQLSRNHTVTCVVHAACDLVSVPLTPMHFFYGMAYYPSGT